MSHNKTRICKLCGKEFVYTHNSQVYCQKKHLAKCPICGKERLVENGKIDGEYSITTCSKTCQTEKRKQSNLEKYGVEFTAQLPEVQAKIKATNLERYGAENVFASDYGKQKIKETTLERYGVEYIAQSQEIKDKIEATNMERYGTKAPAQNKEVQAKMSATNLERYGAENYFGSEIGKAHIKEILQEKYGVSNATYTKVKNGPDWEHLDKYLEKHNQQFNCMDLAEYFGVTYNTIRFVANQKQLQKYIKDFHKYSQPELLFKKFIDTLDIEYLSHSRKIIPPYELDFYFPDQKLAVEISPTFTHKFMLDETYIMGIEEKEYHYNKFKACEDAGIELITVFDWVDVETIFNLVKDKITKSKHRIYARKCEVKNVGKITKKHRTFLTKYHVLGSINNKGGSFVLELTYDDLLVGIAVFYPHKDGLELKRLAFRDDYTIVGGASKLVKHAGDKPIITFSDNNLGTGSVYKTIGFELIEDNKYSLMFFHDEYGWLIRDTSLWMVGADRLLQNFPGYKPVGIGYDKPNNREIVLSYGFTPIFDCGYRKWRLDG